MSAVLREGQKLRRRIRVYGVDGWIIVTLTNAGISFQAPRTKIGVSMTWPAAVASSSTPENVPAAIYGKPLEFLQRQAKEAIKRAEKRIDAKESA